MLKRLIGDFGIYGIAPIIPKVAGVAVLPLITPFLTKEDYGLYGIVMAYTGFFGAFYTLGLFVTLSNSFYKSRLQHKWLWRQVYGFLSLWNVAFAGIVTAVLYFAIPESADAQRWSIIGLNVIPLVLFGPTEKLATLYYQLRRKPLEIGLRGAIFGILNLVLVLVTIRYLRMGYMGWFWALFVTQTLTNLSWWIPLNLRDGITPIFNFKWRTLRRALAVGLPVVPHQNAQFMLDQSDRIVMDLTEVSARNIGSYTVAYQGAQVFSTLSLAFSRAMAPQILELLQQQRERLLRRIIFGSQAIFLVALLVYACFAKEFFAFLFRNDGLNEVYQLSVIICAALASTPMYMGANNRLFYHERTKTIGLQSLYAAVLNVGLNFIFIPRYGITAAAVTTLLSYLFLAYSRYYSATYRDVAERRYYPTRWLLATVAMAAGAYFISGTGLSTRLWVAGAALLSAFFLGLQARRLLVLARQPEREP